MPLITDRNKSGSMVGNEFGVPMHDPRPRLATYTDYQSAVIDAGLNMQRDRFRSAVKFATGKERVEDLDKMECALAVAQLNKIHK